MKKLLLLACLCLLSMAAMAQHQRCEVIDFYVNDEVAAVAADQLAYAPAEAVSEQTDDYVDLGLPSGTKWKSKNEPGFYTFRRATNTFSGKVPEKWQWQELMSYCEWQWTEGGYKVTSRNGKSIFLPVTGWIASGDFVRPNEGWYWTATKNFDSNCKDGCAWRFAFSWNDLDMDWYWEGNEFAVRLVRNY